ncbi:hypothetical protein EBT16_00170 [bacterium]|nr:hypothetical protein [bacterium]
MTVGVETDSGYQLFHLDMAGERAFHIDGRPVSAELLSSIFSSIRGQQEATMPQIPYDQIYEVMNTEKTLAEENGKHVFRRQ